ncbi:LutC/YkgG family protein [Streptomyces sp. NBC_00448]|uniref:LutC/YkgG family protein n=1 Tax=Streptomyces sp. NBC_00448 TaxID=2903652 RepID=UPI002E2297FF
MTHPAHPIRPADPAGSSDPATPSSRDRILARVRAALADRPGSTAGAAGAAEGTAPADPPIPRDYARAHVPDDPASLVDLLATHLADYRAHVHRCTAADLPRTIAELLTAHGSRTAVVPPGLPDGWLRDAADVTTTIGGDDITAAELDRIDSVVTGCALAIAETGTIVLDASPDQGRRVLTLVPDHHVCVVRVPEQVVASVPQALPRLDPVRPLTWISGPSATSDIELDRVEGVHGPRTLDVVLVAPDDAEQPGA